MTFIAREIELPEKKSFFLFGPRQTGKSTLIKSKFIDRQSLYFDLLKTDEFRKYAAKPELIRSEIEAALQSGQTIRNVLIDEIQKIPAILDEVHWLLESYPELRIILSGSSARKLKRMHANMLGGRVRTHHLYPLTCKEIGDGFNLDRALHFGTIPSIYLAENDDERAESLRSYISTYLHEEIEIEAQLRNVGGFLRFLPLAGAENGSVVNFSNIARECGLAVNTIKTYYQILEDTLLGFFLFPFGGSVRQRIARHPKFYFFDTGIVTALQKRLKVQLDDMQGSPYGNAFEHFILSEIHRLNEYRRLDLDISYFRTDRGAEVDCILKTPLGKILAIEIKSTRIPGSHHCSGLASFSQSVPDADLYLACRTERAAKLGKITALPWQQLLEMVRVLR